ncbi:hypothetical protein BDR26DRAFT_234267 [Obelidium mucronatum]|nr:hypothetical protein BDR26DRAFT_234267 [Obelidium mucronatum]
MFRKSSSDIENTSKRVVDAEMTLRVDTDALREAQLDVKNYSAKLKQWVDVHPDFTGYELTYKALKQEVEDSRSYYLSLAGKSTAKAFTDVKYLYDLASSIELPEKEFPAVVPVGLLMEELFQEESKLFFIRECYGQFYENALAVGQSCRILLSGTPGIGKSLSLLYIIIRQFENGSLPKSKSLDHDSNYIVLLNNAKGNPVRYPSAFAGINILASSPKAENYDEWMKRGNDGGRLYAPTWTLAELEHFRKQVFVKECKPMHSSLLEERFHYVGGVARPIFSKTKHGYANYLASLAFSLNNANLLAVTHSFELDQLYSDRGKDYSKVIHCETNRATMKVEDLKFCSGKVLDMWITKQEKRDQIIYLFGSWNDGKEYKQALLESLQFCAQLLCRKISSQTKQFDLLAIKAGTTVKKNLSEEEIEKDLKKVPRKPTVLLPKARNYKAFDGFLYNGDRWFVLQVTINEAKTLKPRLLREFAQKFPNLLINGELHWYGIVLPSIGLRTTQFSMENDKDYTWAKENVVQHVIPFPRQTDSLSNYSRTNQSVLLGLKNEIYKGASNRIKRASAEEELHPKSILTF